MKNFDEPLEVIGVKRMIPPFKGSRNTQIIYLKFRYSNKYEMIEVWYRYDNVKKGQVKNYLKPLKYDTYYGKPTKYRNLGSTRLFNLWLGIHERCNHDNYNSRNYFGKVTVCDEWRSYQNFIKWLANPDSNYIKENNQEIDKDLFQWNYDKKIYSPKTCVFLPKSLNRLLSVFSDKRVYDRSYNRKHHTLSFNHSTISISNNALNNNYSNFRYCRFYVLMATANYYYNTCQINTRIYNQLKSVFSNECLVGNIKDIAKNIPKSTLDRIDQFINEQVHKMKIRDKIISENEERSETRILWSVF